MRHESMATSIAKCALKYTSIPLQGCFADVNALCSCNHMSLFDKNSEVDQ